MTNPQEQQSDDRLKEILHGCEGVTPGPWFTERQNAFSPKCSVESKEAYIADCTGMDTEEVDERNAAHIARLDPDTIRSIVSELLALRALHNPPEGWQPIETAPKDGTEVWVYVASRDGLDGFQCRCAYHEDAGWCADELREVTHWRPLPAPPVEARPVVGEDR